MIVQVKIKWLLFESLYMKVMPCHTTNGECQAAGLRVSSIVSSIVFL